jgi:UDP-N-acetylmuramoyl-tripeptide--D-alanyl-D-alanine ligase
MPQEHTYFYDANVESKPELEAAKRAIADLLKHEVRPDDLVLLKGSRGMQIETLLTMF